VAVFCDRKGQPDLVAVRIVEAYTSFHEVPAIVFSAAARRRLEVNLFDKILTDIRDIEVAGSPIKGEAPRVAQSVRPDFVAEGITRRNGVWNDARLHIDPQDFAEESGEVLAVAERIAATAAIAECDVKEPVRAKRQLPAVVVSERLADVQQGDASCSVGNIRIGREGIACHHRVTNTGEAGVIDVKISFAGEPRRESKAQQTLFAARGLNQSPDVEKWRRQNNAIA
jgi:hypothetical protein